jgi:flagellar motility protein MotE (MotC chaperone)
VKNIRLLPIVVAVAGALLVMKVVELATQGGPAAFDGQLRAAAREAMDWWSDQAKTSADDFGIDPIVTGSADAPKKPAEGETQPAPAASPADPKATAAPGATDPNASRSEDILKQRLGERRNQIQSREEELKLREQLLKAAEGRIEQRVNELKGLENRIGTAATQRDQDRKRQLGDLVKMYEAMRAKDAARVFDRLAPDLLVDLAAQMNPRKLGDIVAKMSPEQAEKLTIELAARASAESAAPATPAAASGAATNELPKIEGKPIAN